MNTRCSTYQNQIPQALLGDLSPSDRQALESHIEECSVCFQERELYSETLQQLGLADDVAVPRHFLVYPAEPSRSGAQALSRLLFSWRTAAIAAGLAAVILAFALLQIRREAQGFVVRIGQPQVIQPSARPAFEEGKLKAELLGVIEEKSRAAREEVIRTLRAEIATSNVAFTRKQRILLEAALADAETRLNHRLAATATSLDARSQNSIALLFRAVTLQHERDFATVNDRLNRIALSGEIKSHETDAILETLLEVAEVRMSKTPGGPR